MEINDKEWHKITDEEEECYRAYYKALGIGNKAVNDQIRAIELLNIKWYYIKNKG